MPTSRSPKPTARPARPARRYLPIILIGVLVVLGVLVSALPASMLKRFLPLKINAEDFSGSIWHGSAGKIAVDSRDLGAVEWHLHPLSLLGLNFIADVRWVKVGFVIDGTVQVTRQGVTAHDVHGGGPIDDLHDLGVANGWHGLAAVKLAALAGDFHRLTAVSGSIEVSGLTATDVAGGADLGGYTLEFAADAVRSDDSITARLKDTGGPVEAQAQIQLSPASHIGMLSGTVRERPQAAQALRDQLDNLSQLKPRDSAGRIPVELEFTL